MKLFVVPVLFASSAFAAFSNVTSSSIPVVTSVAPSSSSEAPASNGTADSTVWTTEVDTVTALTTYCPLPTTITTNGKTYTVSEATTLTITDCPCEVTKSSPVGPVSPESTVWTTEVETVTELTTYCPLPTTITTNGKTYTVSEATTLTITDCPCEVTKTSPVPPATESSKSTPPAETPKTSTGAPKESVATVVKPSSSASSATIETFNNAGNRVTAGLTGMLSFLAFLL
ncbi:protein SED1 [Kluyveromyces marxianus]|jgi:hypothetical protein|uniref:Cell wall protein SED1 n=2 Tax=Kluyveromyces marxianus TaxID=4911 RepID=W0T663_KLUMD|nr:hypothetical protein KLMA_20427 [Kluyveromyces marxianus DMKU3-1042]QGN14619.1 protein SED1 [Kluyveromyces marxianus]BAO38885.1 hypothetical protein KLMA_20427 [Kluyveromyces marxianus DMKU3-1042]